MDRREFINKSYKLLLGWGIYGSIAGCKPLHDFYSFDGTLRNGINWSNFQLSVNIGSERTYDTAKATHPTVIKDGSTYKMWYTGSNGANKRIIYCDSSNGISWSNFQLSIDIGSEGTWDTLSANTPCVIKDNGVHKMWYAGNDSRIIYCESSNGINWSNFQLSVDKGSEGTYDTIRAASSTVIKDGSTYKMWYNGQAGGTWRIIYCESSNGINWSNFQLSVNIGSQGTYDTTDSLSPSVINVNGLGKMWYAGSDGTNSRIIYCESY